LIDSRLFVEQHTSRCRNFDCILYRKRSVAVDAEHLNDVGVAAGAEQIFSVRGDGKVARMCRRVAVGYRRDSPVFAVYLIDGNALVAQTVAGVEVVSVGRKVDVRTAASADLVAFYRLHFLQMSTVDFKNKDFTRQFRQQICVAAIFGEGDVSRTAASGELYGFNLLYRLFRVVGKGIDI
jgi:hypothetical protein